MDKQPLNTGEQKDMTEFFTDLITKIEEISPELVSTGIFKFLWNLYRFTLLQLLTFVFFVFKKNTVKSLFGGVITNNVVSLVSI